MHIFTCIILFHSFQHQAHSLTLTHACTHLGPSIHTDNCQPRTPHITLCIPSCNTSCYTHSCEHTVSHHISLLHLGTLSLMHNFVHFTHHSTPYSRLWHTSSSSVSFTAACSFHVLFSLLTHDMHSLSNTRIPVHIHTPFNLMYTAQWMKFIHAGHTGASLPEI